MMEPIERIGGYGDDFPFFWIAQRGRGSDSGVHVAFRVEDRETVDAFHEAALAAGGKDNGEPGVREIYHPHYYGAFVLDPDGNNVEAVCHTLGLLVHISLRYASASRFGARASHASTITSRRSSSPIRSRRTSTAG